MYDYVPINNKEDIPVGENLTFVTIRNGVYQYNIGGCTLTSTGHKLIMAGGRFHFDMGKFVAYKLTEPYTGEM